VRVRPRRAGAAGVVARTKIDSGHRGTTIDRVFDLEYGRPRDNDVLDDDQALHSEDHRSADLYDVHYCEGETDGRLRHDEG
jgi:hypothetical protein